MNTNSNNVKILLVENSKLYQEMIKDMVLNLGYDMAFIVESGEKAIEYVKENQVNVVLMDIGLDGEIDGIETSQQIKEFSDVPVIYLTAHTDSEMFRRAKVTSPYSYLVKPVDQRVLNINLEIALHNYKLEKELQQTILEKEYLLQEVNHRVKNNLQILKSLISLQRKHLGPEQDIDTILMESEARIEAMSLVHDKLNLTSNFKEIPIGDYLKSLVNALFDQFSINNNIHVVIDVDAHLSMASKKIVPLGLIVNEIVTNSIKYAFPNGEKGEFFIKLQREETCCVLKIGDNGIGIKEKNNLSNSESLGINLISILTKQLDATVDIENQHGLVYIIKFLINTP